MKMARKLQLIQNAIVKLVHVARAHDTNAVGQSLAFKRLPVEIKSVGLNL